MVVLFFIPVASIFALRKEDWVHDRHMYLTSVPFCLVIAVLLTDLKIPRKVSIVASSLLAIMFVTMTAIRLPTFKDDLTVYESALKVAPRNILLRRYYAAALWNSVPQVREPSALREQALKEFLSNTELSPESSLDQENYATALGQSGRDEEAATQHRKALQLDSSQRPHLRATILYRLAGLDLKLSKLEEAESCLREAIAIDPKAVSYHALIAQVLERRGRPQEAREQMKLEGTVKEQFIRERATPRTLAVGQPASLYIRER
jgi:hypothetical protein